MTVKMRSCAGPVDFPAISDFLYGLYKPNNRDGNWFQPIWEYAYTHPWFDEEAVQRIGIWEDAGAIVAVALYELRLGEVFFQIDPTYVHLKPEMLVYAEQHLTGTTDQGKRYLKAYVNDFDVAFERVVLSRGYEKEPGSDLIKVDRVLWRGFNHFGEPPADGPEGRKRMQSGPHFRKDLTIVVEAPNGAFVAYSGLWFDPINRFGYVEPVATDPDYRRMGLGIAAVLEGIRRCGELGASVAYVGSDMPFYLAMGFEKLFTLNCWIKYFSGV